MPNIITVTNTADTGYGEPTISGSLRDAIETAQPGDTIQFDPSLANQTITLERRYDIETDIIIDGSNAPGLTISGNQEQIIFRLAGDGREFTLQNLTLADAYHEFTGAVIWAADPNTVITVENSAFNNNIAGQGAAIWAKDGANVTVINSQFDNNQATQDTDSAGGAISVFDKSQLTVQGSEFTNNEGFAGGAITTIFTPLTIEDSVFRNNESRSWGGAVNNDGASVPNQERYYNGDLPRDSVGGETIIRNSVFEDNTAVGLGGGVAIWGYDQDFVTIEGSTFINNEVTPDAQGNAKGGGLRVTGKLVTIENSTIANNTSAQEGGGLWYWEESPFNIINTTFSGNQAAERGGAIYNAQWGSETNIVNTTFANNSAGSESGAIYTGNTRPVIVTNSIFDSNTAGDSSNPNQQTNRELGGGNNIQSPGSGNNATENITITDPLLGALQDIGGTFIHPLLPGSPAIDAGTSVGAPVTDQTGAVRPQDGDLNGSAVIDIGAYESPGTLLTPEIQLLDGSTDIADGTTVAIGFGNTLVGTPLVKTFTLVNSGTAALNLGELQLPTGFSLVGTLPTTVAAGGETALTIQLDAAAVGTSTGEISFATNDSDENPFNFAISGNVTATATSPEIQVLDGDTDIVDGSTVALDFGSASVGSTLAKTFSIQNLGSAILTLEAPVLPEGFSIVGDFPSTVAAGDSASFTLALDTTIAGTYSGTLTFGNNDSDESPFDFTISGTVDSPPVLNPINGTDLSETLIGTVQDDRIDGLGGQDILSGDLGNDQVFGGTGHDRIWGRRGDDLIYGGEGHDQLNGGADQDSLWGEAGNDQLCGNLGDDWLNGGLGNDTLTGGEGRDTFVLGVGHGNDLIRDFQLGEDSIGMAEGLSFEQVSLLQKHSQTWIVDTAQGELLARLDDVDATSLSVQSATTFVLM